MPGKIRWNIASIVTRHFPGKIRHTSNKSIVLTQRLPAADGGSFSLPLRNQERAPSSHPRLRSPPKIELGSGFLLTTISIAISKHVITSPANILKKVSGEKIRANRIRIVRRTDRLVSTPTAAASVLRKIKNAPKGT
jgi:hypothetical protein